MRNKAESLVELLNKAYKPLYFDMLMSEFSAAYRLRCYDRQSNEFFAVELSYQALEDTKVLEKLIPQIEAFHMKHHNKLAKLLRGEE